MDLGKCWGLHSLKRGLHSLNFLLRIGKKVVGGLFLWFQWDTLLLEADFLTCIVAPLRIIYLSKRKQLIETFRLLFASGIVKLSAYDRTWWNLTAMFYHYQSQCLPTPLLYYAHHIS
ncbi:unnamed protein product [Didymodactylos carnosus]|uniref:Lipase maturation factor n=1 Tax=Didymodactylos carnosus TaxID=1234261 RepID=A0A8S2VTX1_9BILA|nr:unnamed protein product [Didymodactylos carnosus]